jgi:hypothetical protein
MKREAAIRVAAVAAWLLCGALPLYVLTQAQDNSGRANRWATNVNGNMNGNGNMNAGPAHTSETVLEQPPGGNISLGGLMNVNLNPHPVGPSRDEDEAVVGLPIVSAEWEETGPVWGRAARSPLVLRAGAGSSSRVVARPLVEEGETVSILETAGDGLRVRVEAQPEFGRTRRRAVEGWVEWGAVEPVAEALVVEAASGELVRRVPLEGGVTSVLFAPDGATALLHGNSAPAVYEVSGADLKPRRKLQVEGIAGIGGIFFQPGGAQLVVPVWRSAADAGSGYRLDFLRVGEGPAAVVPTGVTASGAGRFLVSGDGLTGFALNTGGASWGGAGRVTVAVFDMGTLTQIRGFLLPDSITEDDDVALGPGGSELFVLSSEQPSRLTVVESMTGSLVREVKLATIGAVGFRRTEGAAGPLIVSYAAAQEGDDASTVTRWARLTPEGALVARPEGLTYEVEAAGQRYAVDEAGRKIFVLDEAGRVRASRPVRMRGGRVPAAAATGEGDGPFVLGLYATPDGKRLIIIKGFEECGC